MNYVDFRRHLGKAGLTVNSFAKYLGVRPASVSNYAKAKEVPRTYAMLAVLMGDMVDQGGDLIQLLSRFGVLPILEESSSQNNVHQFDMFRTTRKQSGLSSRREQIKHRTVSEASLPDVVTLARNQTGGGQND